MALKTLHLLTLTLTAAYEAGTITMSLWQERKKKKEDDWRRDKLNYLPRVTELVLEL